jgi:hypothetical protein
MLIRLQQRIVLATDTPNLFARQLGLEDVCMLESEWRLQVLLLTVGLW